MLAFFFSSGTWYFSTTRWRKLFVLYVVAFAEKNKKDSVRKTCHFKAKKLLNVIFSHQSYAAFGCESTKEPSRMFKWRIGWTLSRDQLRLSTKWTSKWRSGFMHIFLFISSYVCMSRWWRHHSAIHDDRCDVASFICGLWCSGLKARRVVWISMWARASGSTWRARSCEGATAFLFYFIVIVLNLQRLRR